MTRPPSTTPSSPKLQRATPGSPPPKSQRPSGEKVKEFHNPAAKVCIGRAPVRSHNLASRESPTASQRESGESPIPSALPCDPGATNVENALGRIVMSVFSPSTASGPNVHGEVD